MAEFMDPTAVENKTKTCWIALKINQVTPCAGYFYEGLHSLEQGLHSIEKEEESQKTEKEEIKEEIKEPIVDSNGNKICKWKGKLNSTESHLYRHWFDKDQLNLPNKRGCICKCDATGLIGEATKLPNQLRLPNWAK